jgi:hypothetical protein
LRSLVVVLFHRSILQLLDPLQVLLLEFRHLAVLGVICISNLH